MKLNQVFLVTLSSLLVLVISGCGNGTKPATPSPTSATRATPISATLSPDASASRIKEFQDKGNLSKRGAAFLASTKLEVTSSDKNVYQFVATLPTNTAANITVSMTPNQKYTPTPEEAAVSPGGPYKAGLTHTLTGNTYALKLEYFLPQGALPVSLDTSPKTALYQPAAYRKTGTGYDTRQVADGGGEQTGTRLDFEVALVEAGKEFVAKAEEVIRVEAAEIMKGSELTAKEVAQAEQSPLTTTLSSALEVVEVLDLSVEYQELVTQLDEAQENAENPTNPLTQKAYADDPNLKQSILDEIDAARFELKWDAAAQYLNSEVSVGAGLMGLPELTVAMKPVTDWNGKTLKQVMKERVANIVKMITTGSFKTNAPSKGTANPVSPGNPANSGSQETVKPAPGTWVATYEGVHKEVYPSGLGNGTITDKGTITFTVKADSSVAGSGRGHLAYHKVATDSRTDGETDYSFTVSGVDSGGEVILPGWELPSPMTFAIVVTPKDGPPQTSMTVVTGPMLPQGNLKLQSGGTLETHQDNSAGGLQITETRTITIN